MRVSAKFLDDWSDHIITMIDSGTMILLITALTGGICVLCLYSVYGNVIRHETTLHDLRNRVELLHNQQTVHLAELTGEIAPESPVEGEILDEEPNPEPVAVQEPLEINAVGAKDQSSDEPVSSATSAA